MGRIRKALSITSVAATGGLLGTPVRWESSAEKAAREQARLMKMQNELIAKQASPPDDPSILKGRCPKCSRPVVWYAESDKTPVHTATGKFECPPDADSQDSKGVAAELERLAALHSSGMLDDEEFRAAKTRIIHGV